MKAVFVADFALPSASGMQRCWALEFCGVEVHKVQYEHYRFPLFRHAAKYIAVLAKKPRLLYNAVQLEIDILLLCEKVKPDIIWLEWPIMFVPSFMKRLQIIKPKPLIISFQDDNPWGRRQESWRWSNYLQIIPYFDLHLVKRDSDLENLKKLGAKKSRLWRHGIYTPLFYPNFDQPEKKYPVTFIGTYMDNRAELINYLLEKGLPLHVFGPKWHTHTKLPKLFPDHFHKLVLGEDYANVLRNSMASIIVTSRSNCDEWTMRSYEVPACACASIVETTPSHIRMFKEGETGFLFSDEEECARKIEQLIKNPAQAIEVGIKAEKHFRCNGWFLEERMKEFLDDLKLI